MTTNIVEWKNTHRGMKMTEIWNLKKREQIDDYLAGRWGNGENNQWFAEQERKNIDRMVQKYKNGELILDEDGAGHWASNGRYIFDDNAYEAFLGGVPINLDATEQKRAVQVEETLAEYRRNWKPPSGEALAEMRAEFGEGTEMVDVLSGRKFRL